MERDRLRLPLIPEQHPAEESLQQILTGVRQAAAHTVVNVVPYVLLDHGPSGLYHGVRGAA